MDLAIVKKMVEAKITPGKLELDEKLLVDEQGKKAYKFVCEFFKEHGTLPAVSTIEHECEVQMGFLDTSEPIEYYIAQLNKRAKMNRVGTFIKWAISSLEKDGDPEKVVDLMRGVIRDSDKTTGGNTWSISEEPDRRMILDAYEDIKSFKGKPIGIETPWPFINEVTGGILPGHFISLISHTSIGKTWLIVKMAVDAHKQGKSILIVSPEMSQEIVRFRIAAAYLSLPYGAFRKGLLSTMEEERIHEFVETDLSSSLVIADASVIQTSDQVEYFAQEYKPDLIFIDSYYLLDVVGRYGSTNERREALTIGLYNQAKRSKIPYVVSTHFSSSVKKDKKGEGEDVAYTKQAIRLTDLALGVHGDEEMESQRVRHLKILKHREGIKADLTINFDLSTMDFSQLTVDDATTELGDLSSKVEDANDPQSPQGPQPPQDPQPPPPQQPPQTPQDPPDEDDGLPF